MSNVAGTTHVRRVPWRRHLGPVALTAAPIGLLFLFLYYPIARLVLASLSGGSLQHFQRVLDPLYLQVFSQTLIISLYVTACCLVLGYPVAHFLCAAPSRWASVGFIFVLLPLWTSVLVRTYAWIILLGRNGVINRALLTLGIVDSPVPFLYNVPGVVIGMIHVLLPLMVLPLYAVMRRIDPDLLKAAAILGASPLGVFAYVYLPLSLPGVLAGFTLVFILSAGFYITPAIMGGGRVLNVAMILEQQSRLDLPFAAALAICLLVITLFIYGVSSRLLRGSQAWS
ncbi:MAG: ABC transporter permease [Planctomycetes bacterium]|nr:ABC transporter permease [Planctomycetota bacterium]